MPGRLPPSSPGSRERAHTRAHALALAHSHTRTPGWPRRAPSGAGLLGRHLPVGGFQTSRESQKLHGLQTPESPAGPGPLPTSDAAPRLRGQEPSKGQDAPPDGAGDPGGAGTAQSAVSLPTGGAGGPVRRGPARSRPAGVARGDPKPGMGRRAGRRSPVHDVTGAAADCPRPRARRTTRPREAGAWKGLGAKGIGLRARARPQAGAPRPAVRAARAGSGLGPRGVGRTLEVPRALPAKSQLRAAAEWEGGGRARAPPSPPAVTGAITLLAADGYQLARASLSPLRSSLLPSPPPRNCWLHLNQRARKGRPRPTASGDLPRLLARGAPPGSPGRAPHTPQRVPRAPQPRKLLLRSRRGGRGRLHALQDPCSPALARSPAPGQGSHPDAPNPKLASVFQASPGPSRCAFQVPSGRLDRLPETSEAFALLGIVCGTQTAPPTPLWFYTIPEGVFEAVKENSGLGLKGLHFQPTV